MRELHETAGAVFGEVRGASVVRRYGEPAAEYEAAVRGVAVRDRSHRARLVVAGRDPRTMLQGVVTGRLPGALEPLEEGVHLGRAEPNAVLTAKGRVVSLLRLWPADLAGQNLAADVPHAGREGLLRHFGRYLPPRFATVEDVTEGTGMLTVLGPEAPLLLTRDALGLKVDAPRLEAMAEGDLVRVELGGDEAVTVIRTGEVATPAWDVVTPRDTARALWRRLLASGATAVGSGVWEALRLEAGVPAYGADLDDETLLPETGLHARVVDAAKGCYTGQEVVVRIRDRGHVNRHLRKLRLSEGPTPAPGTELWAEGMDRAVGTLTSVALSPREGTLALGYVRREVEVPGTVRVGGPEGPEARAEEREGVAGPGS